METKRTPAEETEAIFEMAATMFSEWSETLGTDQDTDELLSMFCKANGCTRNSILAAMFSAFCGGIVCGMEMVS